MKKQKPLYITILTIFVFIVLIYDLTALISRIANKAAIGHLLIIANDLTSMVYLLIFLNINYKVGILLYGFSFLSYIVMQYVFFPSINTGIKITIILRLLVVICLSYSWLKNIVLRNRAVKIMQKNGNAKMTDTTS